MLAKRNHPFWKNPRARMAIAVVIEAVVVVAVAFHNSEIWFGRQVPLIEQFVLAGLIIIAAFVYVFRTHSRITKEAQESIMTAINEQHAGIKKAFSDFEGVMAEAQMTLSSLGEKAFAETQKSLSSLEETLMATGLAPLVSWQNDEATRPGEFEFAYQVRVAIDCIRFAVKATEQSVEEPNEVRQASLQQEANLQLLDALDRLQSAERSFQVRFRLRSSNATFGIGHEVPWPVEERIREAGS
jgi:hypothetical protein